MSDFLGFGVSGYRSLTSEVQRIGPLEKISLLAGANNSGKSNVLTFAAKNLRDVIAKLKHGQPYNLSGLDVPIDTANRSFVFSVPVRTDDASLDSLCKFAIDQGSTQLRADYARAFLKQLLALDVFSPFGGISWLDVNPSASNRSLVFSSSLIDKLANVSPGYQTAYGPTRDQWRAFWSAATHQGQGDFRRHWIPETLVWLLGKV